MKQTRELTHRKVRRESNNSCKDKLVIIFLSIIIGLTCGFVIRYFDFSSDNLITVLACIGMLATLYILIKIFILIDEVLT